MRMTWSLDDLYLGKHDDGRVAPRRETIELVNQFYDLWMGDRDAHGVVDMLRERFKVDLTRFEWDTFHAQEGRKKGGKEKRNEVDEYMQTRFFPDDVYLFFPLLFPYPPSSLLPQRWRTSTTA